MKIQSINFNTQFTGMVPLKNYKGPMLKLTKADKEKIAALQENINQMEFELYHLERQFNAGRLRTEKWNFLAEREGKLLERIDYLKDMIRNIKIERLNKQKKQI